MKYLVLFLAAGSVYLFITHRPAPPVARVAPPAATASAGTDFLKAPLDRTHQVLDQARQRADDPALK